MAPWRSLARYWQDHADYAKAAGFYGKLIERKSVTLSRDFPGLWVLANLELARCNKALGKNPDALQLYNRFLAQWGSTGQFPSLREVERERDSVLR